MSATGRVNSTGAAGDPDVDPSLFNFGPEADLPETAPVAALPPWMRTAAVQSPVSSVPINVPAREADAAGPGVPRARRHARAETDHADESLAELLSETQMLAGALAELPPFAPAADVEHRPAADLRADDAEFDDDAPYDEALYEALLADEAFSGDEFEDLDTPEQVELPPAPVARTPGPVSAPLVHAQPEPVLPQARAGQAEVPKGRAGLSRVAAVAADAARSGVAKVELARAGAARKAAAEPKPAKGKVNRAAPKAKRVPQKPVPSPTVEAAAAGVVAPKASASTRLSGRTVATRAGILAMAVGAVGIAVVGYGALRSAPTAAALPAAETAAVTWMNNNLGTKASVLAPAAVGQALGKVHFDTSRVITYTTGQADQPDWTCCNVLVAAASDGSDVRSALPSGLQGAYDSSRPIADFDTGGTTVEIRQVLSGTPAAVAAGIKTEHDELVAGGQEVIASKRITLSSAARTELADGDVDSRVLIALAGISAQHTVTVAGFPNDAASAAAGAPARAVEIVGLDGKALAAGSAAVSDTTTFLNSQTGPNQPLLVTVANAEAASGATVPTMVVAFNAPGPLGLLTPTGSKTTTKK